MKKDRIYIEDCGIITPLGRDKNENAQSLFQATRNALSRRDDLIFDKNVWVGSVPEALPALPAALHAFDCRNNRLLLAALSQIAPSIEAAAMRYGHGRIAVIMGTSTSGISDGENAFAVREKDGVWPSGFHYSQQEIGNTALFAARLLGLTGPAYTIATACSSSAKVFASGRRLIRAGIVDAVLVGGADTLCRMTMNGFNALNLISDSPCNPFSINRNGITIGEGASAFLLTKKEAAIEMLGAGETSDAHHPTAPAPDGAGAKAAMRQALDDGSLAPDQIAYINLHGTATPLNDSMEAEAVSTLFGTDALCGSTKGMTGHMLGATGGCEAGFLWLCLTPTYNPNGHLPPHVWDGAIDPTLPELSFASSKSCIPRHGPIAMLSNSFGFGGSNVSLILGRS